MAHWDFHQLPHYRDTVTSILNQHAKGETFTDTREKFQSGDLVSGLNSRLVGELIDSFEERLASDQQFQAAVAGYKSSLGKPNPGFLKNMFFGIVGQTANAQADHIKTSFLKQYQQDSYTL